MLSKSLTLCLWRRLFLHTLPLVAAVLPAIIPASASATCFSMLTYLRQQYVNLPLSGQLPVRHDYFKDKKRVFFTAALQADDKIMIEFNQKKYLLPLDLTPTAYHSEYLGHQNQDLQVENMLIVIDGVELLLERLRQGEPAKTQVKLLPVSQITGRIARLAALAAEERAYHANARDRFYQRIVDTCRERQNTAELSESLQGLERLFHNLTKRSMQSYDQKKSSLQVQM